MRRLALAAALLVALSGSARAGHREPAAAFASAVSPSLGGGLLAIGGCAATTVSVPGATNSMVVEVTPTTYPGAGAFWRGYVSSTGIVTVTVCEVIAAIPTASTYNVRVFP